MLCEKSDVKLATAKELTVFHTRGLAPVYFSLFSRLLAYSCLELLPVASNARCELLAYFLTQEKVAGMHLTEVASPTIITYFDHLSEQFF